jgi:hypothetical protein
MSKNNFESPELEGASQKELQNLVSGFIETGAVTPEMLRHGMNNIRELAEGISKETKEVYENQEVAEKLGRIKKQYDKFSTELKTRCSWEVIVARLLKNNGYYLNLVEEMQGKGVLIGADKEGNPLFADAGDELVMSGLHYKEARNTALFKFDGVGGDPVPTGYELFPYDTSKENAPISSEEEKMFNRATGISFVGPRDKNLHEKWEKGENPYMHTYYGSDLTPLLTQSVWLESGNNPTKAVCATFDPVMGIFIESKSCNDIAGIRRLLRINHI